jgi:hypothetical protein
MDKDEAVSPYILPPYVRFVQSLALVSGVAIGIAAGATVFATIGCDNPVQPPICLGDCIRANSLLNNSRGLLVAGTVDAAATIQAASLDSADASVNDAHPVDGRAGGGPLPAPPLPPAWLA